MKRPLARRSTLISLPILAALSPVSALGGFTPTESNVFALGNVSMVASNIQGQLTAGGDGNLRAVNAPGVYVQGNLSALGARLSGALLYGGHLTSVGSVAGSVTHVNAPLVDFAATGLSLASTSATFSGLNPNGTVTQDTNFSLLLKGTDPSLNVFNIEAPVLNASVNLDVPAGSTVLVNVSGQAPFMDLVNLNGSSGSSAPYDPTHVLFNFYEATSLVLFTDVVKGTILAPLADVTIQGGNETGNLIAGSVSATATNFLDGRYSGSLSLYPVPEPPALALVSVAMVGLAVSRRAAILAALLRDASPSQAGI